MPTAELFVADSAGVVAKRISKLSAWFYQYNKKQTAASNMDPMPHVSVDATHPAVKAASVGAVAKQRRCMKLPQPAHPLLVWQRLLSATTRSTGLACSSGASLALVLMLPWLVVVA